MSDWLHCVWRLCLAAVCQTGYTVSSGCVRQTCYTVSSGGCVCQTGYTASSGGGGGGVLQAFADRYCECNRDQAKQFRSCNSIFLLAYAIIMLNTDLHNKSIKAERRMKLTEFIKNLRGEARAAACCHHEAHGLRGVRSVIALGPAVALRHIAPGAGFMKPLRLTKAGLSD